MSESVIQCPLCSCSRSRFFDRRLFRGFPVENRICVDCGLVFQSPRMTENERAVYYQAEYRRSYQGVEGPITRDIVVQTARAEALIAFIHPKVTSIERCLDIGCSTGLILKNFQNQFGCLPVGIEPGNAYRTYALGNGINVYQSLEEMERAREDRFDMIIMSHVLEHVQNPVGYLDYLRKSVLTPEGWLLIEVPNLYAHDSFEVAHLFAFTPHSLKEVLRKGSFTVDKAKEHGQPNSLLLPLYLTMLCRPTASNGNNPVKPEKFVSLKRQAGMLRRRILEHLLPHQAWLSSSKRS
jgi:2-polyprenyl-3-methyl-5-hydroxy-6-metoxy-1,4-benzoquinol methylase